MPSFLMLISQIYKFQCLGRKICRSRQDSNLRGQCPSDFESDALTTRPSQHVNQLKFLLCLEATRLNTELQHVDNQLTNECNYYIIMPSISSIAMDYSCE